MLDILLTRDGDLRIDDTGDITLTESVRQAVRVRLLWFFQEWRFWPDQGVPYYEEILIKNPNPTAIKRIIREKVKSAAGVTDVENIRFDWDRLNRSATVTLDIITESEVLKDEVIIFAAI